MIDRAGCGLPQTERRGDWMQTFTGRQYWPLDPRADEVELEDIAHHLSMICRYCGACNRFYSVAEHSIGALYVVEQALALPEFSHNADGSTLRNIRRHTLLHDAPEAYCHDIIRPIKRCITGYAEIEGLNFDAIAERTGLRGLSPKHVQLIKQADNAMLLAEQDVFMREPPAKWAHIDVPSYMPVAAARWLAFNREGWLPARAKAEFLDAYERLTG